MKKQYTVYDTSRSRHVIYEATYGNDGSLIELYNKTTSKNIPLGTDTAKKLARKHKIFIEVKP